MKVFWDSIHAPDWTCLPGGGQGGGGLAGAVQSCTDSTRSPAAVPREREMLSTCIALKSPAGTVQDQSWPPPAGVTCRGNQHQTSAAWGGSLGPHGLGRMPTGWPMGILPWGWIRPCSPNPVQTRPLQRAMEQRALAGGSCSFPPAACPWRCQERCDATLLSQAKQPWRAWSHVGARGWGEERRWGWLGLPLPALPR